MIGISYRQSTPKYDAYLKMIQERLLTKKCEDPEVKRFISDYIEGDRFEAIMNTPACQLGSLITEIEQKYPQLKDCRKDKVVQQSTPLYQYLKWHLMIHGYKEGFQKNGIQYNLDKEELIESVGIDVCPYCNRTFIYSQQSTKKQKIIQAELDHFYSKDLFPYLAIAKYNLVPSCSFCNRQGGKYTTDAYEEKMVNPYEIQSSADYLKFRLRVKNANMTSLNKMAEGLKLKLIANNPNMRSNIDVMNLEELYQHHTDYAAELYFKWKVKATHIYRKSMKGVLRKCGINLTDDDIKRIIVGNYVKEPDFGKRPLSIMMHDVSEELGLI
jgi:5-methylcytosine-specific restriction endonuclease McrA